MTHSAIVRCKLIILIEKRGISGVGPSIRQMAASTAAASPSAVVQPSSSRYRRRLRSRKRRRFFRRLLRGTAGVACLTGAAFLTVFGGHLARIIAEAAVRPRPPPRPTQPRLSLTALPTVSSLLFSSTTEHGQPQPSLLGYADRPFLVVYTAACVMSLLLVGFACLPGWWQPRRLSPRRSRRRWRAQAIDDAAEDDDVGYDHFGSTAAEAAAVSKAEEAKLSDPHYVPVQFDSSSTEVDIYASLNADYPIASRPHSGASGAAADEASPLLPSPSSLPPQHHFFSGGGRRRARGVRFSRVSEVRQLSESEAHSASMARMSYQAYRRAIENSLEATEELEEDEDADDDGSDEDSYEDFNSGNRDIVDSVEGRVLPTGSDRSELQAGVASGAAVSNGLVVLSVVDTGKLALMFAPMWFLSAWCLLESQRQWLPTQSGVTFIFASITPLAGLLLSTIFPSASAARASSAMLTKTATVLLGIGAAFIVAWPQLDANFRRHNAEAGALWGALIAALGALCIAACLAGLRRRAPRLASLPSLLMLCGFVGLASCLIMWPGFFILHYSNLEQFQLPNATNWGRFIVQGVAGVALPELLLLVGCYLTSSLSACMSFTLAVPLAYAAGLAFLHIPASEVWRIGLGGPLTLVAFLAVALWLPRIRADAGDPLLRALIACRDLSAPTGVQQLSSGSLSDGGQSQDWQGQQSAQSATSSSSRSSRVRGQVRRPVSVPAAAAIAAASASATTLAGYPSSSSSIN